VTEDPELGLETSRLLQLVGKASLQGALPGERARSIVTRQTAVIAQRVAYQDLNDKFKLPCNATTTFNASLVGPSLCDASQILFDPGQEKLFDTSALHDNLERLNESRFASQNAVDLVVTLSFAQLESKMSPQLGVSLFNLSSVTPLSLNRSSAFIEFQLPLVTQRADKQDLPTDNVTCAYYDEVARQWAHDGCERVPTTNATLNKPGTLRQAVGWATCRCSHLTLFVLDVTAAKNAVTRSNALIVRNATQLQVSDIQGFLSSFAFLLILILLSLNLFSIYLHRLDVTHRQNDRFYQQKYDVLKCLFPEPHAQYMDFFANGPLSKEEVLSLIKIGLGQTPDSKEPLSDAKPHLQSPSPSPSPSPFPSQPQPQTPMLTSPLPQSHDPFTETPKKPASPYSGASGPSKACGAAASSVPLASSGSGSGSGSGMGAGMGSPKSPKSPETPQSPNDSVSLDKSGQPADESKENPEEQNSRQELVLPSSLRITMTPNAVLSRNSPTTTRPRLRGSMLTTLYGSFSLPRGTSIQTAVKTCAGHTPSAFNDSSASPLTLRLQVPQYAPCSFWKAFWVGLKVRLVCSYTSTSILCCPW
jgi:hypothetical protein